MNRTHPLPDVYIAYNDPYGAGESSSANDDYRISRGPLSILIVACVFATLAGALYGYTLGSAARASAGTAIIWN